MQDMEPQPMFEQLPVMQLFVPTPTQSHAHVTSLILLRTQTHSARNRKFCYTKIKDHLSPRPMRTMVPPSSAPALVFGELQRSVLDLIGN